MVRLEQRLDFVNAKVKKAFTDKRMGEENEGSVDSKPSRIEAEGDYGNASGCLHFI